MRGNNPYIAPFVRIYIFDENISKYSQIHGLLYTKYFSLTNLPRDVYSGALCYQRHKGGRGELDEKKILSARKGACVTGAPTVPRRHTCVVRCREPTVSRTDKKRSRGHTNTHTHTRKITSWRRSTVSRTDNKNDPASTRGHTQNYVLEA